MGSLIGQIQCVFYPSNAIELYQNRWKNAERESHNGVQPKNDRINVRSPIQQWQSEMRPVTTKKTCIVPIKQRNRSRQRMVLLQLGYRYDLAHHHGQE